MKIKRAAAYGVLLMAAISSASAQQSVWFRENFNANPPQYGFGYKYPDGQGARITHLAAGGWNNSGAAQVRMLAGHSQYAVGWVTPTLNQPVAMGGGVYIRFRIRFDDDFRWNNAKNKFILMGQTGTSPNSRVILYQSGPSDSMGCSLGMMDYNGTGRMYSWATPSYFGLSGTSWQEASLSGRYGSISPYVNISWSCGPPALVTYGNNSIAPAPGPNSARPSNGWYHFQVYAQSGAPGQGAFRMWVNNNTLSAPTSQQIGLQEGLGVTNWPNAAIGGYVDDPPAADVGYRIDDFEIGPTFDPNWSGGGTGSVAVPNPPTNLNAT
jgi:hypothetical protein